MKGYTSRGMWCSDFQYGFRFSRSNVNLLTVASDRSARAFNMYGAIRFVAFDGVSKAFDKVCHAALLYKRKSSEFWVRCLVLFFHFLVIDGFQWFWFGSIGKNIKFMLGVSPFLVLHFSCFILMIFLMMMSLMLLSMVMILLLTRTVIGPLIKGNRMSWYLNFDMAYEILWSEEAARLFHSWKISTCLIGSFE